MPEKEISWQGSAGTTAQGVFTAASIWGSAKAPPARDNVVELRALGPGANASQGKYWRPPQSYPTLPFDTPSHPQQEDADMTNSYSQGEIDAQNQAIEARTDAKFARFEGKIDLLAQEMRHGFDRQHDSSERVAVNVKESETRMRQLNIALTTFIIGAIALATAVGAFAFNAGSRIDEKATAAIDKRADDLAQKIEERLPPSPKSKSKN